MGQAGDRPTIESGIAAIRRRWPGLRNDWRDSPIFVLAAGWRSGSTLLQRLIMPSCFLWGEPYGHAGLIETLADPIRAMTLGWPEPHFFHRGEDPQTLSTRFIANLYPSAQDLLFAHQAFFERLFVLPATRAGARRWGLKEVRLSVDHAIYLRWLFPPARFLFLIRNPYDAYRSYAAREALGWRWHRRWPDEPITTQLFGRNWLDLAGGFVAGHRKVDGLLVRYEDLARGDFAAVEDYLGLPLSREAAALNPRDGGPPPLETIPPAEYATLEAEVEPLASALGYRADHPIRPDEPSPERPGG
jgi:hypothetical protein